MSKSMINFDKVRSCVQDLTSIVSEVGAEFGAGASKEALKNAVEAKVSERDLFGDVSEDEARMAIIITALTSHGLFAGRGDAKEDAR